MRFLTGTAIAALSVAAAVADTGPSKPAVGENPITKETTHAEAFEWISDLLLHDTRGPGRQHMDNERIVCAELRYHTEEEVSLEGIATASR